MDGLSIIIEVSVLVLSFCLLSWALILHCCKPRAKTQASSDNTNVVSINSGKHFRLEENLQEFLEAEDALARNEHEKYMALRMQALENAKRNLSYRNVAVKRVS